MPKPSRNAQIVLRGFLRRDKSGIDAVSAYCLDIVAALKRGDVQLPLPSQAAEEALSSYLLRKNDDDDDDDSSSVTSFRSYVSSTNSYATMTTATTTTTAAREDVYESRLQAFNSVSTLDTRSLFGHSVIPDDESLFSSRRGSSRRSTSSSSTYDDDDDDDLHAPPGMTEKKEKKKISSAESLQKDAIVKVQRWFRKNVKSMQNHHDSPSRAEETRKRRDSIVHIQRHFRGWRVRRSKKKTKTPWRP